MTLVSTKVPSIRKSPWGYGGFLGSLAHTTVKTTTSPVSGSESTFWMNCVKALGSLGTNTYAEFDEIKVLELADPDPINLNFSHTLWDGSLFGDV